MKSFYSALLTKEISFRQSAILYGIGTLLYSISSVFLLLFVIRFLGVEEGGIFSIGWAVSQLMYAIGLFGTRNVQVADINERFSPSDFFESKKITILFMLVASLVYSFFLQLNFEKILVAVGLTLLMVGEVLADVSAGFFQHHERLDIPGKSYIFRVLIYDLIFIIAIVTQKNLLLAIFLAATSSICWLFLFDYQLIRTMGTSFRQFSLKKVSILLSQCFPIFISAFLTNYIINIPKNSIELFLTDSLQAAYNVIFMPSFIITLFMSLFLTPMYTSISELWQNKKHQQFNRKILQISLFIISLTLLILLFGFFLGIPVLSFVYKIDLSGFKLPFLLLIISGGINSFVNFWVFLLTVIQRQYSLLYIYGLIAIFSTILTPNMIKEFELLGAALSYLFSILFIGVLLSLVFWFSSKKIKKIF